MFTKIENGIMSKAEKIIGKGSENYIETFFDSRRSVITYSLAGKVLSVRHLTVFGTNHP